MTRSAFLGAAVLLPLCIDAVRNVKRATAGPGRVSHLFTFGAPHTSSPALKAQNGKCFNGYRVVNYHKNGWAGDSVDAVPSLLTTSNYDHPNIEKLEVRDNTPNPFKRIEACGESSSRIQFPSIPQHDKDKYITNVLGLSTSYSRVQTIANVGLKISYESNLNTVKSNAQRYGWRLVGSATAGEDISHLLQDENSKRCILTFEGSDSSSDFMTDINIVRVSFCGLGPKVHQGFRNELRRVVKSAAYQSRIRRKLGKCASVDVTGHSLGGAVATLFAACVDNQVSSSDYNDMSWQQGTPTLMASL